MKDFYIKVSTGDVFLICGQCIAEVRELIARTKTMMDGWLDVRVPATYKYVTINVNQIVWIEEDDEI